MEQFRSKISTVRGGRVKVHYYRVQRGAARFVKKIIVMQLLSLVCLTKGMGKLRGASVRGGKVRGMVRGCPGLVASSQVTLHFTQLHR